MSIFCHQFLLPLHFFFGHIWAFWQNFLPPGNRDDLPHVECVLDVSCDELYGEEVVLLARVVQDKALCLKGLELEVHVYLVVGLPKKNKQIEG